MPVEQRFEGIFAEVVARGRLIEWALSGGVSEVGEVVPWKGLPIALEDSFSGPVIDENNDSSLEAAHLKRLLERHLGSTLEGTVVVATLESTDKKTKVEIFNVPLGVDGQLIEDEETEAPFGVKEGEWE